MGRIGKLHSPPAGQFPKPAGYPDSLDDARAIADHIDTLTPGGVDMEFVEDIFRGGSAKLQFCPLDSLSPGHDDQNIPIKSKEKKYAKLPSQTCPPLIAIDGEIQDGHHRYRVALAQNWPGIWCYAVEFDDENR